MMPMIPDLTLDLGNQALSFGWTLDGTALIALVALFFPVVALVVAAIVDAFGASPRPVETGHAEVATIVPLGQAA